MAGVFDAATAWWAGLGLAEQGAVAAAVALLILALMYLVVGDAPAPQEAAAGSPKKAAKSPKAPSTTAPAEATTPGIRRSTRKKAPVDDDDFVSPAPAKRSSRKTPAKAAAEEAKTPAKTPKAEAPPTAVRRSARKAAAPRDELASPTR
eukprot:CAMPEP_0183817790 /NCGR_PEP_ID=MMETSP0803_2-20130417/61055_1 /TAXON_ID=195967 /ORGANISM="Crustomastix stigmata, Strain CCMP3273" /LENGTH=148 /DNA_ID=CAMNT_0026062675 /DNA_START=3 /DNA_END=446 /DNA_ORIENTATION=+